MLVNAGPVIGEGWTCTHASAQFSPALLSRVVNKARQTALNFCLECEKKGIDLHWEADDNSSPQERASWIKTLKEEGTRVIIRDIWAGIRDAIMSIA